MQLTPIARTRLEKAATDNGFDLDRGVALDASGQPSAYTRGPFGNLDLLEGFLSWS